MSLQIDLEGVNEMRSLMDDAPGMLQAKVHDVMTDWAEEAVQFAQSIVPVSTGRLQESIHYEEEADMSLKLVADAQAENGEYYGWFVEFGTSRMPAQPFLRPAVEMTQSILMDKLTSIALEG